MVSTKPEGGNSTAKLGGGSSMVTLKLGHCESALPPPGPLGFSLILGLCALGLLLGLCAIGLFLGLGAALSAPL